MKHRGRCGRCDWCDEIIFWTLQQRRWTVYLLMSPLVPKLNSFIQVILRVEQVKLGQLDQFRSEVSSGGFRRNLLDERWIVFQITKTRRVAIIQTFSTLNLDELVETNLFGLTKFSLSHLTDKL